MTQRLNPRGLAGPRAIVALVIACLTVAACRAVPGDIKLDIQNLSPDAITVVTEEPGQFLFANTNTHVIPPWTKGRCNAHLGLFRGHIKVTVSGSNIASPLSYEVEAATADDHIVLRVDGDGHAVFGGTLPDDVLPCVMAEGS